jgi:hypothetical protein
MIYRRSRRPGECTAQTASKIVLTEAFREVLVDCHLCDLGLLGPNLCSAILEDNNFTKERLDRAMVNLEWCDIFWEGDILFLRLGA